MGYSEANVVMQNASSVARAMLNAQADVPKEPSLIEMVIRNHRCIADELAVILGRLESIGHRTYGPRPEEGQISEQTPQPIYNDHEIRSGVENIENLISRLRRAVSEVERIA